MRTWIGSMVVVVTACGPLVAGDGDTSTSGDDAAGTNPTTTGVPPDPSTTSPTTTSPGTTATTTSVDDTGIDDSGEVGMDFIPIPDWHRGDECDIWNENCPPGMKCMPWANDGGSAWNSTKCVPIAPDPGAPGEPCTVEGNGVSGIDDCELHAMCWDVDPETNEGECVAFCTGDEANPMCEMENTFCNLTSDGVLILCLPYCDPIAQDCDEGSACYPVNGVFTCAPDASGEVGALGDPCEFINVCDPGLFCAPENAVPMCEGASGCCAAYCNVDAGTMCEGWETGIECVPWYEAGEALPGYENLGACILPD
ncbi:MAG TPA: ribulose phosphate epimerase [Nannocystaceae bacterium]|nr:ribulose phosphate epimerase [Nannocystaceae bacterium]